MSVRDVLIEKSKSRRHKRIKLWEQDVICVLCSMAEIERVTSFQTNDEMLDFVSKHFLDPETEKPVFSKKDLHEQFTNAEAHELLMLFFKHNGAEGANIGELEKN